MRIAPSATVLSKTISICEVVRFKERSITHLSPIRLYFFLRLALSPSRLLRMLRLIRHLHQAVPAVLTFHYLLRSNLHYIAFHYRSGKSGFSTSSVVGLVSPIKMVPGPTNKVFNANVGRRPGRGGRGGGGGGGGGGRVIRRREGRRVGMISAECCQ